MIAARVLGYCIESVLSYRARLRFLLGALMLQLSPTALGTVMDNRLSVGAGHACVLSAPGGGIQCWGRNQFGQLGDGTEVMRATPVSVVGLSSGVASVSAGGQHSCALTTAGVVKCWGRNQWGQLGDGTTEYRATPVDVVGLGDVVVAISAGAGHTCALTAEKIVKCWGYNRTGQVGDGTTLNRNAPSAVTGLTAEVAAVAAGDFHTCVLMAASGGVKCWGAAGFVGRAGPSNALTPVDVVGLTNGVKGLSVGGSSSCAVSTAGGVSCWGNNTYGQLGDGTTDFRAEPVAIAAQPEPIAAVAVGVFHACALSGSGRVRCWGYNRYGFLGDGTTIDRVIPVDVTSLDQRVVAVSAGDNTCALLISGKVGCWGDSGEGIGDGTTSARLVATQVVGLGSGIASISAGSGHNCALSTAGQPRCWGRNREQQLGDGTTIDQSSPVAVSVLGSTVSALSSGRDRTCSLTGAGAVQCWGGRVPSLFDVTGLGSGILSISLGDLYGCALTSASAVKCWGSNTSGQLGNGTTETSLGAVDVTGLTAGVRSVSASVTGMHTCAVMLSGGLKCWGTNFAGQLGDGSASRQLTPVDVTGLSSGVLAVALGEGHTCAALVTGSVKCWGNNEYGQLGDGTKTGSQIPVDVFGLSSGAVALAAGSIHTCALIVSGMVKCWGSGYYGQLGDGTGIGRSSPVDVSGAPEGVVSIAAGRSHTCARTSSGGVKCWGSSALGSVGDGTSPIRTTPVEVVGLTVAIPLELKAGLVVSDYYRLILGRAPDAAGASFWTSEASRVSGLGADVREVFYAMAMQFFNAPEYLARGTSNAQYVTDLYRTFFGRDPDQAGLNYWLGELTAVQSRGALLNSFLFSQEFANSMTTLFGASSVRPEVNMTIDLFRGVYGRLPDTSGFNYWLGEIHKAQCAGAGAVSSKVNEIANLFFASTEYAARGTGSRDFVGDVYNTYLRRGPGGDTTGFNYWVSQVPVRGRDGVRAEFVPSAEFQNRVAAVVAAGCLP